MMAAVRRLARQHAAIVKFLLAGGVNLVVDIAVFNLLIAVNVGPLTAKVVSVGTATVGAYFMNKHWTFRDAKSAETRTGQQFALFMVLNLIGLGITLLILAVSHYPLGFTSPLADNIAGNGIGTVLATAFRFWSYKNLVFPREPAAAAILMSTPRKGHPAVSGVRAGGCSPGRRPYRLPVG